MKTVRTIALALLACLSATANAEYTIVTQVNAIELAPSNIIVPASASGMMTFRPCDSSCDEPYQRVQLADDTKFSFDGKRVKFDDFRRLMNSAGALASGYALIRYDTTTNTATDIEVTR